MHVNLGLDVNNARRHPGHNIVDLQSKLCGRIPSKLLKRNFDSANWRLFYETEEKSSPGRSGHNELTMVLQGLLTFASSLVIGVVALAGICYTVNYVHNRLNYEEPVRPPRSNQSNSRWNGYDSWDE